MDFTYKLPFSEEKFSDVIIKELKRNKKYTIAMLLTNHKVTVNNTNIYSSNIGRGRWDAMAVYIELYVNPNNIDKLENEEVKDEITSLCTRIIPSNVGFDIKDIQFFPDYSMDYSNEDDLVEDLVNNSSTSFKKIKTLLSPDLLEKGFFMSEAYTYMYSIENTLRIFIRSICEKKYGLNFFDKINLTKSIKIKLEQRKKDAKLKKWLSFDVNSEIFYLDFIEIGDIIKVNWEEFKHYFPDQDFIIPKICEIADVRNRIAHNSYIGETERIMLKAYYRMILEQIDLKY